jgi:hypothetical protein
MDQKNASPDYAGDQPQDAGSEQDEKIEKRPNRPIHVNEVGGNPVAMNGLGEGDPVLDTRVRPLLEKRVAKK